MSTSQMLISIFVIMLGTMLTRYLVFLIFPPTKQPPRFVNYLGAVLPPAAMGLLVVYALKDTEMLSAPYGIPELISILVILIVHRWRRNSLVSIATGTILYMVLVQNVF